MKISVMWMTRKRSHELIYSLSSFIHNADDNINVEYIFITDPDDDETPIALEKIVPMAHAHFAELTHVVADKRYYAFSDFDSVSLDDDVLEVLETTYGNATDGEFILPRFVGDIEPLDTT